MTVKLVLKKVLNIPAFLKDHIEALKALNVPTFEEDEGIGFDEAQAYKKAQLIKYTPALLEGLATKDRAEAIELAKDYVYEYELVAYIKQQSSGYDSPLEFAISKIDEGVSTIAAAYKGKQVEVRFYDQKSDEYASLIGAKSKVGSIQDIIKEESNPMLGLRGSALFLTPAFQETWKILELEALKRVKKKFNNVECFTVFTRSPDEFREVRKIAAPYLGDIGMMVEVPENYEDLVEYIVAGVTFFSIGNNDTEQTVHGIDRGTKFPVTGVENGVSLAMFKLYIKAAITSYYSGTPIYSCGNSPSNNSVVAGLFACLPFSGVSVFPDTLPEAHAYIRGAEDTILTMAKEVLAKPATEELTPEENQLRDTLGSVDLLPFEALHEIKVDTGNKDADAKKATAIKQACREFALPTFFAKALKKPSTSEQTLRKTCAKLLKRSREDGIEAKISRKLEEIKTQVLSEKLTTLVEVSQRITDLSKALNLNISGPNQPLFDFISDNIATTAAEVMSLQN